MARKKPSGADNRKRRGMKLLGVPVPADLHAAVFRCAALQDPPVSGGAWAAAVLEQAARALHKRHALAWPARTEGEA